MDRILVSNLDVSKNFIEENWDYKGYFESRYVQRSPEYFSIYLSSHAGCNKSCRFCHLTSTRQTSMWPNSDANIVDSAYQILEYLEKEFEEKRIWTNERPKRVNFNFMARGEPLSNVYVARGANRLFAYLSLAAKEHGFDYNFNISSIIPAYPVCEELTEVFQDAKSKLYYSLYSVLPKFRKKWLPKAMDPFKALDMIAKFQKETGNAIVLHWAFIEGENDSNESIEKTMEAVVERGIKAKFNLVRYNPYSERQGKEVAEERLQELFNKVNYYLDNNPESRIIPRVGYDVKASCGMFVTKKDMAR